MKQLASTMTDQNNLLRGNNWGFINQ